LPLQFVTQVVIHLLVVVFKIKHLLVAQRLVEVIKILLRVFLQQLVVVVQISHQVVMQRLAVVVKIVLREIHQL